MKHSDLFFFVSLVCVAILVLMCEIYLVIIVLWEVGILEMIAVVVACIMIDSFILGILTLE